MTSGGFELIDQVTSANSTGEFQLCSDDVVLFTGTSDQLTFMRGGANTVVAYGTDQTIESGGAGACRGGRDATEHRPQLQRRSGDDFEAGGLN